MRSINPHPRWEFRPKALLREVGRLWPFVGVFVLALAVRGALLEFGDPPPVNHDQLGYFYGGLSIAERAHPIAHALRDEDWHVWIVPWVRVPLYHLFVAAVFRCMGPHLVALRLAQCLLGAACSVVVALLGRSVGGPLGIWAGVAYALFWPAAQACLLVQAENLHTPLIAAALVGLAGTRGGLRSLGAGALVGLSALARAVSAPFLLVVAAAPLVRQRGRARYAAAVLVLAGGMITMFPWALRNRIVAGSWFLETTGTFNLWWDNWNGDKVPDLQGDFLARLPPREAARLALRLAWASVRGHPRAFLQKVWTGAAHLIRPEGLDGWLIRDRAEGAWAQTASLLLGDGLLVPSVALFVLFLVVGPREEAWWAFVLWVGYYTAMVVVVFHVEIRYRGALVPVVFAGGTGGLSALLRRWKERRVVAAAALGVAIAFGPIVLRVGVLSRTVLSDWALRPVAASLSRGAVQEAWAAAERAASYVPDSPEPWVSAAEMFARSGDLDSAIAGLERARRIRPGHPVPLVSLPRLLAEVGRDSEASEAAARARALEPSEALAVAWRVLPVPRADSVCLGENDYGFIRGFADGNKGGRWTQGRGEVRFSLSTAATDVQVLIDTGSPAPSPWASVAVVVEDLVGGHEVACEVGRRIMPCLIAAKVASDRTVHLVIRSPTWNHSPHTPSLGVFVSRVSLGPPLSR